MTFFHGSAVRWLWNERKLTPSANISGSCRSASAALSTITAERVAGGFPSSTPPANQIHGPGVRSRALRSLSAMMRVWSLPVSRTSVTPAERYSAS